MISINQAPPNKKLRIVEIEGGQGFRRRLFSLSFHKNDIVEIDSKSIFGGPILIKNLTSNTSVALGRGLARKIWVEIVDEKK